MEKTRILSKLKRFFANYRKPKEEDKYLDENIIATKVVSPIDNPPKNDFSAQLSVNSDERTNETITNPKPTKLQSEMDIYRRKRKLMSTDLELYRVFCEVVKYKNISKTAENMHISQSAITQSIQKT